MRTPPRAFYSSTCLVCMKTIHQGSFITKTKLGYVHTKCRTPTETMYPIMENNKAQNELKLQQDEYDRRHRICRSKKTTHVSKSIHNLCEDCGSKIKYGDRMKVELVALNVFKWIHVKCPTVKTGSVS